MDDPIKVYTLINYRLIKFGFTKDKADRYAKFCQAIYKELKDRHDVIDGLKKVEEANKRLPPAVRMNLLKSTGALKDRRLSGGVAIVAPFVDRFTTLARQSGIELNECCLSVVKVAMDIGGAGTGAVSSVGLVGVPLVMLSVIATFNDGYGLTKACFQ